MFKLRREMCATCIYGPNWHLPDVRDTYVGRARDQDRHHLCHQEQMEGQEPTITCAGWYRANPGVGNLRRIAERLNAIELVD